MDVAREVVVLAMGVGATLLGRWAWDRAKAPDRAEAAAREADERLRQELARYGRRTEDRFVLREVCQRCQVDQQHQGEAVARQLEDLKEEMRRNFTTVFDELRRLTMGLNGHGPPKGGQP
jgi:hypothetical protein